MNFKELEIKNFLTVGEAKIELSERGLLLIQGVNRDDPSAKSNGAGKSSVVDALCWALYGVTAREVSGDAVVNKTAKKDCRVAVTIVDGPHEYRIARHRKHSGAKNSLVVGRVDGASVIDMTKGTDKETQEVVNAIMGCSLDVFMAAVYAGQERMPDLPGMTDKMLKVLIEEAAGVEVLTDAYSIASKRLLAAQKTATDKTTVYTTVLANKTFLESEVVRVTAAKEDFERLRGERAKEELTKMKPYQSDKAEAERELLGFANTQEELEKKVAELKVVLDGHADRARHLATLTAAAAAAERTLVVARTRAQTAVENIRKAERSLAELDSQVGKPCGECGKPYCEHDLETARLARQKAIDDAKAVARPIAQAVKDAQAAATAAHDEAEKFSDAMPDVSAVAAEQTDLQRVLNDMLTLKTKVGNCETMIRSIKDAAMVKLKEPNPFDVMLANQQKALEEASARYTDATNEVQTANAVVRMLEDAVKVFGPAGVRAHVLDTVTPYLNERTRTYLGAMADGNIHAVWSTLSKTAKGELREKFNIEVSNDKGAESFAGLSGGEKRKVRLATAMALQDMVAGRATKPVNIFIADEVDHALDENGLERLMTVLEQKAKERGTVLVISHNSLSDWIDEVITVTKDGGYSTVSGATKQYGSF